MTGAAGIFRTGGQRMVLAIAFLALAAAGAVILRAEVRAYSDLRNGSAVIRLLDDPRPLAIGYGQRVVSQALSYCFEGLDALSSDIYTAEMRQRGGAVCRKTAERVLQDAPTHAAARQLLAESLWLTGQPTAAAMALRDAARLAPNTMWLSKRRLLALARLEPALRMAQFPDSSDLVARLIATSDSRSWLARLYFRNPQVRSIVEAGAGALPTEDAKRFLATIRAQNRQGGN